MRVAFVIQDLFSQGAQRATALMARGDLEELFFRNAFI